MFLHVQHAEWMNGHSLRLAFDNGKSGVVDLSRSLDGPVFAPLKDVAFFKGFHVEGGTVAWPNGADFAPEYLLDLMK